MPTKEQIEAAEDAFAPHLMQWMTTGKFDPHKAVSDILQAAQTNILQPIETEPLDGKKG